MILHFLQIIANYCKLKLDFALRLLSLQIIAHIADIANYCKLLHIDPHLCTQTSEFAHSQPGLLSDSMLCPAPDEKSRFYNYEYYILLICNKYIKYISK